MLYQHRLYEGSTGFDLSTAYIRPVGVKAVISKFKKTLGSSNLAALQFQHSSILL